MDLSFRRVAGRFVLAAGVCAAAILVFRADEPARGVTFVIDPRPLGPTLRHLDVDIAAGDQSLGSWQSGDRGGEPLRPLRLTTPVPAGDVTITLDLITADGPHRIVHHARPTRGSTVEIVLGQTD